MDYRQIKQIKAQNMDALLFVRIGDFYEAFAEDAVTLSKELDLVLTGRNFQGASERIPMTGVPYHTLDLYIAKLVEKGYKVAIAESPQQQRETAAQPTINQNKAIIKENPKMENNNNATPYTEEERTEIVGQSKAYLTELLSNGNLKRLFELIGNNGRYTLNNTLFMMKTAPDITLVKNMGDWNDLGRSIIPNSKSIEIMSPIKEERTVEQKDGAEPELDENGQPKVKKYTATTGFKPTYVFDISQTTGKEYKPFKITEKISDEEKRIVLKGVRNELSKKGYKIDFVDAEKLGENESGRVDRKTKKVEIRKGMDNYATTLTLLHQSANALAGAYRYRDFEGLKGAEAYALEGSCMDCILAAHFGMDTGKFDFSYTKAWNDDEKSAFYNNANLICITSTKLMEGVDHAFEYNATQKQEQNAGADKIPPANRPSLFRGISQQSEFEAS